MDTQAKALAEAVLKWHEARTKALKSQPRGHPAAPPVLSAHMTTEYRAEIEYRRVAVELAQQILEAAE